MELMKLVLLSACQLVFLTDVTTNSTETSLYDEDYEDVSIENRIIGGNSATIELYPFTISIHYRHTGRHHCGGTYITPKFILTAAHCLVRSRGHYWTIESAYLLIVVAGTTTLRFAPTWQISHVDRVLPHSHFNYVNMAGDIGLLKISTPFSITPYVHYSPLPLRSMSEFLEENRGLCTVIGWGKTSVTSPTSSATLRYAKIPLIPSKECRKYFGHNLHSSQICAGRIEGGVDACQGDSGGPLVCDGTQVGIVSWGQGCAMANSPGVYCRVDFYLDWINETIAANCSNLNVITHTLHLWQYLVLLRVATYLLCSACKTS